MNARITTRLLLASISALLCFAGQLLAPAFASARTEVLRWSHPSPQDVVRFELLIGAAQGAYSEQRNLGLPTPNAAGVYSSSFEIEDATTVYIALRAVGSSLSSDWQKRVPIALQNL